MYVGGVFREENFLFLINGFVLDKTLSKSIFKSEKRNSLQIEKHSLLFIHGLYLPYAQSIIKSIFCVANFVCKVLRAFSKI